MAEIMRELRDYADHLARSHDIGAMTLQLTDRTGEQHRSIQIFNLAVPSEASWTYQSRRLFAADPFTDVELNEAPDIVDSDALITARDERIVRQRARCGSYWGFLDQFGLDVEGVSTRRLRRGVYTSVGFLRLRHRSYARPLPLAALGEAASMLHALMAAEVLRGTLESGAGLMAVQRLLRPAAAGGDGRSGKPLSPREQEIATLVGQGEQTKAVAFRLRLSEHTVENHLRSIYAKLGIHNRTALARLMG